MKFGRLLRQKRGISIVELLVGLAVSSIILTSIIGMFLYSAAIFRKSESLSRVQSEIRMASDYVTTELRNVEAVSLTPDAALTGSVDRTGLSVKYPLVRSVQFEIKVQGDRYLAAYTIEGSDDSNENPYRLQTEVLLNNITGAVTGTGDTVYYRK